MQSIHNTFGSILDTLYSLECWYFLPKGNSDPPTHRSVGTEGIKTNDRQSGKAKKFFKTLKHKHLKMSKAKITYHEITSHIFMFPPILTI